ncbi:MAG TPA: hypothetical protein P5081_02445 [Phycisphaerae bacterium]|nr:hypothetical protein [Phycisphaerae bacterium]HRW51716.1 hypothetical protein [Phycisphaerae bacterium]
MKSHTLGCGPLVVLLTCIPAFADLNVTSWDLHSGTDNPVHLFQTISDVSNPLIASTRIQVFQTDIEASYDFAWSPADATGDFSTTLNHTIRPPFAQGLSSSRIRLLASEDVRVTLVGELSYSHSPGLLAGIGCYATIYDEQTSDVITDDQDFGGEAYQLPSSGALSLSIDTIIPAGTPFEIRYSLNTSLDPNHPGVGAADVVGDIHISINPIPEPGTALPLWLTLSAFSIRRRAVRHSQASRMPSPNVGM